MKLESLPKQKLVISAARILELEGRNDKKINFKIFYNCIEKYAKDHTYIKNA